MNLIYEWIKRYGAIAGAILTITALVGAAGAYADSIIDRRVEAKLVLAGMAKQESVESVQRGLNGLKEQVNGAVVDRRVMQQELKALREQNEHQSRSIQQQLNLIIKLVDEKNRQ